MIKNMCNNHKVWICDKYSCNKRLAQYKTFGGYEILRDHFQVECGIPQCDQSDTRFFCVECWEKIKQEMIQKFNLQENEIKIIEKG